MCTLFIYSFIYYVYWQEISLPIFNSIVKKLTVKINVIRDVWPCSFVNLHHWYSRLCCLHHLSSYARHGSILLWKTFHVIFHYNWSSDTHPHTPSNIRGGADKSLARPISLCRRTESIVSLERGVYLCAELQVFSSYRGWKKHVRRARAISTTSRRELSSFFFFATQGPKGYSRHSERKIRGICTIVYHRQKLNGPIYTWWFFHLWWVLSWTTQNSDHPGDYWANSRANLERPPAGFRLKQ
jgi:hypothetical protein